MIACRVLNYDLFSIGQLHACAQSLDMLLTFACTENATKLSLKVRWEVFVTIYDPCKFQLNTYELMHTYCRGVAYLFMHQLYTCVLGV